MIEVLGWSSTVLVLAGYIFNAKGLDKSAMVLWIVGDIGWITYDIFIQNMSHMVLSLVIIIINLYGIYNNMKRKKRKTIWDI
tara:strand:+ start:93 stop:338 length:246 start_codon:yes stop_codon:yes gene_type:complete